MKRLPSLLDETPSPLVRAAIYALVPIVLVVALPILLLVILILYLLALFHGARIFVTVIVRRTNEPGHETQKPHFLEWHDPAKALPDETTSQTEPPSVK